MPLLYNRHILTLVAVVCLHLLVVLIGDVHPVIWSECLGLHTRHHLAIVEVERIACSSPCIVDEDGANTVVSVRVDRPVGDYHIWFFGFDEGFHFFVASFVDLGITINLCHKYRTYSHDLACFFGFSCSDGTRLFMAFAWDASFARGEVYRHYFYAHFA